MKNLYVYFIILFSMFSVQADYGYLETMSSFVKQAEEETKKHFGDEVLQKLYEYRLKVQEEAYSTTLRLCAGYRMAVGYGLPDYHKKIQNSYYSKHPNEEVRVWANKINEEYGEMVSSSLQEWLKLVYEGGVQPFSAMFGLKSDYLAKKNAGLFEFESWFHSLYSLFLLNSLGFLQAAVHCLGTMDKSEIDRFASTVMIFDSEASLVSHFITFWTGAVVLKYIWTATRWVFRPVGKMTRIYSRRFARSIDEFLIHRTSPLALYTRSFLQSVSQVSPRVFKYTALSGTAGAVGLYVYHLIDERVQAQNDLMEEIRKDMSKERNWDQVRRAILFSRAVEVFFPLYQDFRKGDFDGVDCWECLDTFQPFYHFLEENFNEETWFLIEEDYVQLKEKVEVMDDRQKNYFLLLDNFLPLLEGFYSKPQV